MIVSHTAARIAASGYASPDRYGFQNARPGPDESEHGNACSNNHHRSKISGRWLHSSMGPTQQCVHKTWLYIPSAATQDQRRTPLSRSPSRLLVPEEMSQTQRSEKKGRRKKKVKRNDRLPSVGNPNDLKLNACLQCRGPITTPQIIGPNAYHTYTNSKEQGD